MSGEERCPECSGYRGLPRILHDTDEPRECSNEFHKSEPVAEQSGGSPVLEFPGRQETPAEQPPHPPVAAVLKPVCPYCLTEAMIHGNQATIGPFEVCVVRCGNVDCRKILGVFQALQLQMMPPPGLTH